MPSTASGRERVERLRSPPSPREGLLVCSCSLFAAQNKFFLISHPSLHQESLWVFKNNSCIINDAELLFVEFAVLFCKSSRHDSLNLPGLRAGLNVRESGHCQAQQPVQGSLSGHLGGEIDSTRYSQCAGPQERVRIR